MSVAGVTHIGPYRLLHEVGAGGMGRVYIAVDPRGRAVAVKLLHAGVAADPGARSRLAREASALERIDVPGVAAVLDADLQADAPYLVTRYVHGPTLTQVIGERGALPPAAVYHIAAGLAQALSAIHQQGVIHRDVKPANVLLDEDRPVLIDFGIAHCVDGSRMTQTGLVMGTPGYLAPEVIDGQPVSAATDWWGWAATLAYTLTGRAPFGRDGMEAVLSRVLRGQVDVEGLSGPLAEALTSALDPDPPLRSDPQEVLDALQLPAVPATQQLPRLELQATSPPHTRQLAVRSRATDAPPTQVSAAAAIGPSLPVERAVDPQWHPVPPAPSDVDLDPRIQLPRRQALLASLGFLIALVAGVVPVVAGALLLGWLVAARTSDRVMIGWLMRRHSRGPRRSDRLLATLTAPWQLLLAISSTVALAIPPVLVGGSSAVMGYAMLRLSGWGADVPLNGSVPLVLGTAAALITVWWGPGGTTARRGSRMLARAASPGRTHSYVVTGIWLGVGAMLFLIAQQGGLPNWVPWSQSPLPSGVERL